MYGKKQWFGKEVEGRYSDIMTMFIRDLDHKNYNSYGINIKNITDIPHYYFTIEYMMKCDVGNHYEAAIRWILDETECVVTIEATDKNINDIPPDLFNRCHIIYRIADSNVAKLKKTDTLSIDAGWYRVHQIMKCNLMEITPDDYKFDRTDK